MRALLYFAMATIKDEETQRRGCVGIYYGVGQTNLIKGRTPEYWRIWSCLPVHQVALHYCRDNAGLDPARWILSKLLGGLPLSRFRFHYGKPCLCWW
jgi:hypothetical protein